MSVSSTGMKVSSLSPVVLDEQREAAMGINVSLHPLPILNMSEHVTRTAMQSGSNAVKVLGALLGSQSGREVEIQTTFEFLIDDGRVDHGFLQARQAQFKQVFPTFDFLGWYSNGPVPLPADMEIHKQLLEYNESPLFLQLSPTKDDMDRARAAGELPIGIYETYVEVRQAKDQGQTGEQGQQAGPSMYFRPAHYQVETGEAERIAVDHASKPPVGDEDGQSSLIANLTTQQNAVKMLLDRIQTLVAYVEDVQSNKTPRDHEALRQIASLVAGLPASGETEEFKQELLTEYNDLLLTTYLADMTSGMTSLNELVDKFDLAQPGNEDTLGGTPGWFKASRGLGRTTRAQAS